MRHYFNDVNENKHFGRRKKTSIVNVARSPSKRIKEKEAETAVYKQETIQEHNTKSVKGVGTLIYKNPAFKIDLQAPVLSRK